MDDLCGSGVIDSPISPSVSGGGRRLNLNHNSLTACVHGVGNVCSVVVRTTETMAIYWECGKYRQRRYLSTKRGSVFVAMRALVLC